MKPVKLFSLIYLSYRPGGIDLLVESLRDQAPVYELIVVDDYPGRAGRGQATEYIKRNGIPLAYYGPSKEHSYPEHCNGLVNAMNTGAMWAATDYVVFLHDYTWLPPGALRQWLYSARRYFPQTVLSGIATMHAGREPEVKGDLSVWHNGPAFCARNILQEREQWIPKTLENFYVGMPTSLLEHTNGLDERADCGHISWSVTSLGFHALRSGCQLAVDNRLHVHMVNHRVWENDGDDALWLAGKYTIKDAVEPEWGEASPNAYNFREQRLTNVGEHINDNKRPCLFTYPVDDLWRL